MLVRKIIAVYYDNPTKPIYTLCGHKAELLAINAGGTYSYLWAVKG